MISFHKSHGKFATLTAIQPEWKFGKLWLDGDSIYEFAEKKDNEDAYINWGFMVLNKRISDYIHSDAMPLEKDPLEHLAQEGNLQAYKHKWFWSAMDTLKNKEDLNELRNTGKAPWKIW